MEREKEGGKKGGDIGGTVKKVGKGIERERKLGD